MSNDPELAAMAAVVEALEPLDQEARDRVLRWAGDRFGDGVLDVVLRVNGWAQLVRDDYKILRFTAKNIVVDLEFNQDEWGDFTEAMAEEKETLDMENGNE